MLKPERAKVEVNPGNPTGMILPKDLHGNSVNYIVHFVSASAATTGSSRFSHLLRLERLSAMCQRHQVWLVVDNTYEHFTYEEDGRESTAVGAEAMAFDQDCQSKLLLVDVGCL